jgi:hypothetical protein
LAFTVDALRPGVSIFEVVLGVGIGPVRGLQTTKKEPVIASQMFTTATAV